MNVLEMGDAIIDRLRDASNVYSLRELGTCCDLSYECLRKIIDGRTVNVRLESLMKIEAGLDKLENL